MPSDAEMGKAGRVKPLGGDAEDVFEKVLEGWISDGAKISLDGGSGLLERVRSAGLDLVWEELAHERAGREGLRSLIEEGFGLVAALLARGSEAFVMNLALPTHEVDRLRPWASRVAHELGVTESATAWGTDEPIRSWTRVGETVAGSEVFTAPVGTPPPAVVRIGCPGADQVIEPASRSVACGSCGATFYSWGSPFDAVPQHEPKPVDVAEDLTAVGGEPDLDDAIFRAERYGEPVPGAVDPGTCGADVVGFRCTRAKGHEGSHVSSSSGSTFDDALGGLMAGFAGPASATSKRERRILAEGLIEIRDGSKILGTLSRADAEGMLPGLKPTVVGIDFPGHRPEIFAFLEGFLSWKPADEPRSFSGGEIGRLFGVPMFERFEPIADLDPAAFVNVGPFGIALESLRELLGAAGGADGPKPLKDVVPPQIFDLIFGPGAERCGNDPCPACDLIFGARS